MLLRQHAILQMNLKQGFKHNFSYDVFTPTVCDNMFFGSSALTDTFGSSGARFETVVALAAVASHRVDTAPVLADARLGTALVQVCQRTEQRMGG